MLPLDYYYCHDYDTYELLRTYVDIAAGDLPCVIDNTVQLTGCNFQGGINMPFSHGRAMLNPLLTNAAGLSREGYDTYVGIRGVNYFQRLNRVVGLSS